MYNIGNNPSYKTIEGIFLPILGRKVFGVYFNLAMKNLNTLKRLIHVNVYTGSLCRNTLKVLMTFLKRTFFTKWLNFKQQLNIYILKFLNKEVQPLQWCNLNKALPSIEQLYYSWPILMAYFQPNEPF